MSLVDANIILRYLLNDIPEQSKIAKSVLTSGNVKISGNLLKIFSLDGVMVENEEIVVFAVAEYGNSKLDFVDELLYANSKIKGVMVKTFDGGLQEKLDLLRG